MSGLSQEIVGFVIFLGLALLIYHDAKTKVSYSHLVLFGIVLMAFFVFFTIYEWKFVGF